MKEKIKKKEKTPRWLYWIIVIVLIFIIVGISSDEKKKTENKNISNQTGITQSSQTNTQAVKTSPESQQKTETKKTKTDSRTYSTIIDKVETYKLPVQSGKWQTCLINQINSLSNIELLQFQHWLFSLSPMMDEEETLVIIARKLNCPEPTIKTIPAKIEILNSWSGTGSKIISSQSFSIQENTNWQMILSWQNSPFNQNFGTDAEEVAFNRANWEYGLVDYPEEATITGTPIIIGFYSPSGSDSLYKSEWPSGKFDFLRIQAPNQSSWFLKIENIVEPEKRIIE